MKTFYLVLVIMLLSSISSAQGTYKIDSDGNISDFYIKTQFYNFCEVDFDFDKAYNCMEVPQSIIIDVDSDGTGKLHLFIEQKTTFYITKCYKSGNSYQLNIKNSRGTEFKGALFVTDQNRISKFYFQAIHNNTGFMLY